MTISSSSLPTHGGLERAIERAGVVKATFADAVSRDRVPTYVLGLVVMALVTTAERMLDQANTGFALEWAMLSLVALVAFFALASIVRRATRAVQTQFFALSSYLRWTQADEKMWSYARRDPRLMNEILCAQGRDVDYLPEPRGVDLSDPRVAESERDNLTRMFTRYY